ncbi:uncharacterized protein FOBCDRAFT_208964 [Fusarium oxysporum Fo47]|uniref:Uncharacterized protein n=1 Tax=Fusarium oxysporum Fo47 TaxID=660027 RepID=W9JIV0_FUSOX|nr:uncharacterized protein FOBCDRAFT_208964 [Fusarium oxysporum Fo47]EWZ29580.1 hypothetical protein FOZG_16947 [Fusarium oxysporum Fo47]QKD62296.2 hypothetical protein FOBCDRAFT_208964 [Fusarium oxysporum Fo47]
MRNVFVVGFAAVMAFAGSTLASPANDQYGAVGKRSLFKRDEEFRVQVFNGRYPDGEIQEVDYAAPGKTIEFKAGCGIITVTTNTEKVVQCDFILPSNLGPGTYRATPAAGYFTITAPASCAGRHISAYNTCTGCGDIGEHWRKLDCHGKAGGGKNEVTLCRQGQYGMTECGQPLKSSGGATPSTTCTGLKPCIQNDVCYPNGCPA